jgi:hypothetical protein
MNKSITVKNVPFRDIIFILISAGVLSLIVYQGHSELLSRFPMIVVLIAYFSGKYIGRREASKRRVN